MFCLSGVASTSGIVKGTCRMFPPSGPIITLPIYNGYNNANYNQHVDPGDQIFVYFDTLWEENHLLTQNGWWEIECKIWVDSDGTAGTNTLTVNTNPDNCMVDLIKDPNSADSEFIASTSSDVNGAVFNYLEDGFYQVVAYKEGYENAQQMFSMSGDKTISLTLNPQSVPEYQVTINTDIDGATITCNGISEYWHPNDPWVNTLPNGNYLGCAEFGTASNCISITVDDGPVSTFIQLFGSLQMVSKLTFTIIPGQSSSNDRYEYDNKFLGEY